MRNGLDYRLETGEYFHYHQSDDNYYDYTLYNKYGEEIDGGMLDFGEDEDYFIEYSEILNEIIETDTKEEFINEFRKWADIDLLNLIKRNIIKENNGRDYALEDLFPDEEEYKEIAKMSDEDLYDKIEEENYMEKNETNDLWYEQITSLNKKDLIDFCKYYKDFVLKENFEEEER